MKDRDRKRIRGRGVWGEGGQTLDGGGGFNRGVIEESTNDAAELLNWTLSLPEPVGHIGLFYHFLLLSVKLFKKFLSLGNTLLS